MSKTLQDVTHDEARSLLGKLATLASYSPHYRDEWLGKCLRYVAQAQTAEAAMLKKARADGLREAAKIIDDNMPPRTNNASSRVRMALNSLSVALVAKADEVEREERKPRP